MPIEIKNLTYVYAPGTPFEKEALRNITLTIRDGEFVGLIGHTGSGKSTLAQHLNGLMLPTSGTVIVDGIDLTNKNTRLMDVRRHVGLVFQYPEYQLFEETVEKDIAFGPANLGLTGEMLRARVTEASALCGIPDSLLPLSPFELSGGQKRRVAIAGVVAMRPDILILDEPAAGLDPAGRSGMRALIRGLHASGATVIMVSHSMDDVAALCERILVMNEGSIAMDGAPAKLFTQGAALREMGLNLPDAAILRDKLIENGFAALPRDVYQIEALADAIAAELKSR